MAGLYDIVQKVLRKFAHAQIHYLAFFILFILAFTIFNAIGATKITLQSDLSELDPQDIPVMKLSNKISTDYEEFESVIILIEIDDSAQSSEIIDIRDPEVVKFVVDLDTKLQQEPTITRVQSLGQIFGQAGTPENLEEVKTVLNQIPGSNRLFDRGYEWTIIFIEADVGGDDVKIKALNDRVNEILATTTKPGGIKVTTTGDAPLNSSIFSLLISDAFFTLIFSLVAITLMVAILQRSLKKAVIIIVPLALGLLWTAGTMGWLGIPITVATAAMGAMLLGLGVEYSIFLISRYNEERTHNSRNFSIVESVSQVGATLFSSGTTTLIGFLALSLSVFPVLSDLGKTLGIGIGYMLSATIIAAPIVILIEEKIEARFKGEKEIQHVEQVHEREKKRSGITKLYRSYGRLVSTKPVIVLLVAIGLTGAMIYGMQIIKNQDVDFETILPDDLPAIVGFIEITDEFGDDSSILILVEINPQFSDSNEPQDIRDPRALNYIDSLTQKARTVEKVDSVRSITDIIKEQNSGFIPNTIASQTEIFDSLEAKDFITPRFDSSLIRITANEEALDDAPEVVRQIKRVIEETERPAGVTAQASGGLVVQQELDGLNQPDSQKTSLLALAGIVIFLYALTRKVKFTILPLLTVVLGIIWTLGLTGFFQVPFNNITQSVITMIIGIGIDFGLQIMNRYNQELGRHDKRKAMEITLTGILTPMIITTIAALIGFRAMGLGQLKIMGDLGVLMSFGILGSMLVSISAVASVIVILQKGDYRATKKDKQTKEKIRKKRILPNA